MIVYLAELRPVLNSSGVEQVLRFSSSPTWTRADGVDWLPMLAVPYRRSTQVFDGAFQSQPQDYGSLEFAVSRGQPISPLTAMGWDGRAVKIWKGQPGQATSAMTLVFDGLSDSVSGRRTRVSVKLRGPTASGPLLTSTYAGTGLAEGPSDLSDSPKPMLLGTGVNLEPQYINRALGIFQYHAYGAAGGVSAVYDNGSELGTTIGDYANYAALAAATVPAGRYATCNALGMGRHGGDITGILTIDAQGAVVSGLPGSVIKWVLRTHLGIPAARVKEDSLDWLDGQVAHAQDAYVTEQVEAEEFCCQIMLSLGGYVWWTEDGKLTVGLVRRGGAAAAVVNSRSIQDTPQVRETRPPVWKRTMGWKRSWRVHSYSEVRTPKEIVPRGTWSASPSTPYQYYDMVDWANASWIYVASTAGNAATPGTDSAVWQYFRSNGAAVVESATTPSDPQPGVLWRNPTNGQLKTYLGGIWVLISDVTSLNTAAAIAGQGALATQSLVKPSLLDVFRGDNLVADPTFADSAYWTAGFAGSGDPSTLTISTLPAALSALGVNRTLRLQSNGTTFGGVSFKLVNSNRGVHQPITPGYQSFFVTASFYCETANETFSNCVLQLHARNSAGGSNYQQLTVHGTVTAGQSGTVSGVLTLPADQVEVLVKLAMTHSASQPTTGVVHFAKISVLPVIVLGNTLVRQDGTTVVTDATSITALGTAAAIAGQAATATNSDFSAVTGPTKPQDNATQTAIGSNELADDRFDTQWTKTAGAVKIAKAASSGFAIGSEPFCLEITPSASVVQSALAQKIPVVAGQRYYFSARSQRGTTLGAGCLLNMGGNWRQADGVTSAGSTTEATQQTASSLTAGAVPKEISWSQVAPTGAAFFESRVYCPIVASPSGTFRVEAPRISRTEAGAGVSLLVSGPATANVSYDSTGTTIQATVDLEYSLAVSGVTATAGVAWSYQVISGTVNGNNSTSGNIALSGAGATTFSVTAMTTSTAVARLKATYNGVASTFDLSLTRVLAASAPGGTDNVSKTSGFTAINTATFTDITGSLTLTTPAGKTATSTAVSLTPKMLPKASDTTGPWNIEFKLQRLISAVWTDIGSVQNSNPDPFIETLTDPVVTVSNGGTMSATISNTGLTASTSYSYRIVARLSTGSPSTNGASMTFTGSVTITCP